MQIQPSRGEIVSRSRLVTRFPRRCSFCFGRFDRPVLAIYLDQVVERGHAIQLLQQLAALPPAAQSQLSHKLLIASLLAGRALDMAQQFPIFHLFRVGYLRL